MTAATIHVFGYGIAERRWSGEIAMRSPHLSLFDSWLVCHGHAIGLELHYRRFLNAVQQHDPHNRYVDNALHQISTQRLIPSNGLWFPQVEYVLTSRELRFYLRPAPVLRRTASVWTFPAADPRSRPNIKGIDGTKQSALRRLAEHHNADEAVLTRGDDRYVVEASYASVVWWEDDTLCAPPPGEHLLASVTRTIIENLAGQHNIEVRYRNRDVPFVATRPAWLLNSLHGIRPITRWDNQSTSHLEKQDYVAALRRDLGRLRQPIESQQPCLTT